jgi:hypothetical protein
VNFAHGLLATKKGERWLSLFFSFDSNRKDIGRGSVRQPVPIRHRGGGA